jgi:hypothetical protein
LASGDAICALTENDPALSSNAQDLDQFSVTQWTKAAFLNKDSAIHMQFKIHGSQAISLRADPDPQETRRIACRLRAFCTLETRTIFG